MLCDHCGNLWLKLVKAGCDLVAGMTLSFRFLLHLGRGRALGRLSPACALSVSLRLSLSPCLSLAPVHRGEHSQAQRVGVRGSGLFLQLSYQAGGGLMWCVRNPLLHFVSAANSQQRPGLALSTLFLCAPQRVCTLSRVPGPAPMVLGHRCASFLTRP